VGTAAEPKLLCETKLPTDAREQKLFADLTDETLSRRILWRAFGAAKLSLLWRRGDLSLSIFVFTASFWEGWATTMLTLWPLLWLPVVSLASLAFSATTAAGVEWVRDVPRCGASLMFSPTSDVETSSTLKAH